MKKEIKSILILDNIRSIHNVGSIFRTADAIGISKIYLTGVTPRPLDRFGRERRDLQKTALGAQNFVSWEGRKHIGKLIDSLKKKGFYILSIEQSLGSVDYKKICLPKGQSTVFVFGNEIDGVGEQILEKSDIVAEIPMAGKKESLNVSVSVGIVLFRLLDKN